MRRCLSFFFTLTFLSVVHANILVDTLSIIKSSKASSQYGGLLFSSMVGLGIYKIIYSYSAPAKLNSARKILEDSHKNSIVKIAYKGEASLIEALEDYYRNNYSLVLGFYELQKIKKVVLRAIFLTYQAITGVLLKVSMDQVYIVRSQLKHLLNIIDSALCFLHNNDAFKIQLMDYQLNKIYFLKKY